MGGVLKKVAPILAIGAVIVTGGAALGALGSTLFGVSTAKVAFGLALSSQIAGTVSARRDMKRASGELSASNLAQDRQNMIRTSLAHRNVIYGTAVTSGALVYACVNGANKEYLHLVIPIADHVINGVDGVWLDDNYGAINPDGTIANSKLTKPQSNARMQVFNVPASGIITLPTSTNTILSVTTETGAGMDDRSTLATTNYTLSGATLTLNDVAFQNTNVTVNWTASSVDQLTFVRIYDGTQTTADPDLIAASNGEWTANHIGLGVAYAYVRLKFDSDVFSRGIPNVKFKVRGKSIFDPRTNTTVFSENPALIVRDYLTSSFGLSATNSEIDNTTFIAAANDCDTLVLAGGVTAKRYVANGVIDSSMNPRKTIESILSSCVGRIIFTGGTWRMYAGVWQTPQLTLTADDLRADMQVTPTLTRKSLINGVRGTYMNKDKDYTQTEFPSVVRPEYLTQDNNQESFADLDLPFTQTARDAQIIAAVNLDTSRDEISVRMPTKFNSINVCAGEIINVTLADFGWTDKPFRITNWQYNTEGTIDLDLKEDNQASWNRSVNIASLPAVATTNLPSPYDRPLSPSNVQIVASWNEVINNPDGSVIRRAKISWELGSSAFVTIGGRTEVQYKRAGDSDWLKVDVLPNEQNAYIQPLQENASYLARVRWSNAIGVFSEWAYSSNLAIVPLAQPLNDVTGLALDGAWTSDTLRARWKAITGAATYTVEVYASSVSVPNLIGTFTVNDPAFFYSQAQLAAANQAVRNLVIRVKAVSGARQSTNWAALSATNAQIAALAGISITPAFRAINVTYTKPVDVDFAGVVVHVSTSAGFTPSSATLAYDGLDQTILINAVNGTVLNGNQTYYVEVAGYDVFGKDALNYSSEFAVTTFSTIDSIDPASITDQLISNTGISKIADNAVSLVKLNGAARNIVGLAENVSAVQSDLNALAESYRYMTQRQWQTQKDVAWSKQVFDAIITTDPATGTIQLLATANVTTDIEQRLTSVETNYSALTGTVTTTSSTVAQQDARLSSAETTIAQNTNAIALKADAAYVDFKVANLSLPASLAQADLNTVATTLRTLMESLHKQNGIARLNETRLATAEFNVSANATDIASQAQSILLLFANFNNATSLIAQEQTARSSADNALTTSISTLATTVNNNQAAATSQINTLSTSTSANASSITALTAVVNNNQASVTSQFDAQATVNNGLLAKYVLNVNAGGVVAGIQLAAGAGGTEFVIQADKFRVVVPNASSTSGFVNPFAVGLANGVSTVAINGQLVVDGSIQSNTLAANSVTAGKIAANAVTANAIAANSITTDKIAANAVTANQIAANSVTADRIDTRNLDIKDAAGNVIFSAGSNLAASRVSGLGALAGKSQVAASDIAVGSLSAISADIGTVNAGRIQNNANSVFFDLNATGANPVLQGGSAFSVLANGTASFNRVNVTNPNVVASGTNWTDAQTNRRLYLTEFGFNGFSYFIDTGVNLPASWSNASSTMYQASCTISSGGRFGSGITGIGEVSLVYGDGITIGSLGSFIDNRIYIRYRFYHPDYNIPDFIDWTALSWKLVQI